MRSHTSLSLRKAKDNLVWVVRQVSAHDRSFVITRDGVPAAAVVPFAALQLLDAKNLRRSRKLHALLQRVAKLLPGAARVAPRR